MIVAQHDSRAIGARTLIAVLAMIAMIAGGGCGGGAADEASKEVPAVIGAETALAKSEPFTESIGAIGTVEARAGHVATLSAPTATRVTAVLVSEGQHVQKGDALIELDRTAIMAEAQSVDAALVAAQQAHARAQRMVSEGIAARKDVEAAAAELAKAQSEAASAHRIADLATLRAPIAGVVTRMSAAMGASVDASQPLVDIADPSVVDVIVSLPATDAARVRAGAKVVLHTGGAADGAVLGQAIVADISGIVDTISHGVEIRAHAGKLMRELRIGETLYAEVELATHPKAITVPTQALVPEGDGYKVFVVDSGGVAHAREVTVGGRTSTVAEITKGLEAGERVVTYGAYGVTDSATIVRPGEKPKPTDSTKDSTKGKE